MDVGVTKDGHRRQATRTFSTMKEARAFISSTRVAITAGTYVAPAEISVADYLDGWLESRRHSIRPKTLEGYRIALPERSMPSVISDSTDCPRPISST